MKKLLFFIFFLPLLGYTQSNTYNYITTNTYREETSTSDISKARTDIIYYDGLGRPIQQIFGKMGGTSKDLITHIEYDNFGRQAKKYLPYEATTNNLSFDSSAATNVITFYNKPLFENTVNPYSESFFENSPLNRVLKDAAPGTPWQGNTNNNNDNTIKYAYLSNVNGEVNRLRALATGPDANKVYGITLVEDGTYKAGSLYKNIVKSENAIGNVPTATGFNGPQVEEFKDKEGKLILKRTYYTSTDNVGMPTLGYQNTYYIYDQYENLTYVIPLALYFTPTQSYIDNYGYQYKYDIKNRLVEKKLPGKDWEYIVYDDQDRPVAVGPVYSPFGSVGNTSKGWLITKYDIFGRIAYTGWYAATSFSSSARNTIQSNTFSTVTKTTTAVTIDNVQLYYTNVGFPTTSLKLLTVNYYDNYSFPSASAFPSTGVEGQTAMSSTKGLLTGSWKRIITSASQTFAEVATIFYDNKGRIIRERKTNSQLGGYNQTDTKLNFIGKPVAKITTHKRTASSSEQPITFRNDYTYNAQDRLSIDSHTIGSLNAELMSSNSYNSIGNLTLKKVGRATNSPLQSVDYSYNIRGWLKGINNIESLSSALLFTPQDLFALKINYTDESEVGGVPVNYNGNITEISWRTSSDNIMRRYSYRYDEINRLRDAYYQIPEAVKPLRSSYDENLRYDYMGNIIQLKRNGGLDSDTTVNPIDNLAYTYTNNKLTKIVDNANNPQGFNDKTATNVNDFAYDSFGNLTSDLNKGIAADGIIYNHLNLPISITLNNSSASGSISYIYNADGVKLKKTVINTTPSTTTNTDYLEGFQYTNNTLDFFPTSEGYVKNTVVNGINNYNYVYQYKDHLGNIRLSYTIDPADNKLKIMEENHYYPFGFKHAGYSSDQMMIQPNPEPPTSPGGPIIRPLPAVVLTPVINSGNVTYRYKYNGKELQDELGLNLYAYGYRYYDPAIARWTTPDPLLNDLDFAYDDSQVDEDDEEEVLMSALTKAKTGGGIYNINNLNPYIYGYNNPIVYDDPDGRCPNCITALIGAAVGGGIELGSQLLSGKSLGEVDWADVGVETLKGGLIGSGVGAGAAVALEAGSTAVKASFDYSVSGGNANVFNGQKSLKSAAFDAGADVVGVKIGGAIGKNIGKSTQKSVSKAISAETKATKNLVKQTNKFNRVTNGGRNVTQTAKNNLSKAQGASKVARINTVKAQMTNSATKGASGQTVNNAAQNAAKDKVKDQSGI